MVAPESVREVQRRKPTLRRGAQPGRQQVARTTTSCAVGESRVTDVDSGWSSCV